ncbi:beta-galactosidase [Streptomyces sp. 6N223]|uniref:beta-galactosidase n=1 Tax=Streptomyces sp. 6N223 TaxID=3457412 RepID=UPI003FD07BEB
MTGHEPTTALNEPVRIPVPRADPALPLALPDARREEGLRVFDRYVARDGRPWLPTFGEFHYSRCRADLWERELRAMAAAGLTGVSSYVFWNHHQPTERPPRFHDRYDLRRFVHQAADAGLVTALRIGPFVHAEARYGGLPDWIVTRHGTRARTNAPAYLTDVTAWYRAIADQLAGLYSDQGGPVVSIQIDNELPGDAPHLLALKRIAQDAGMTTRLWTVTGWGGVDLPGDELIPMFGGYPEAAWEEAEVDLPPSCRMHYHFSPARDDDGIGADLRPRTPAGIDDDAARFPFLTCELGAGMSQSYHRRPVLDPRDIGALATTKLGSGANWLGYYMFHGGTNPAEAGTPGLQESHATGYPNDVPVLCYDFQAPFGETGHQNPSLGELRLVNLLARHYGHRLAPLPLVPPPDTDDPYSHQGLRWGLRSDGVHGFLFFNNHEPRAGLPSRTGVTFTLALPDGDEVSFPDRPLTIPPHAYGIWPVRLPLSDAVRLEWATVQPVADVVLAGRRTHVFAATAGVPALLAVTVADAAAPGGRGPAVVHEVVPGLEPVTTIRSPDGAELDLRVLGADQARHLSVVTLQGHDHLILTAGKVLTGPSAVWIERDGSRTLAPKFLPPLPASPPASHLPPAAGPQGWDTLRLPAQCPPVTPGATRTRVSPGLPPARRGGPHGRASAPTAEDMETYAARYDVALDAPDAPEDLEITITWNGDVGWFLIDGDVVADQFWHGRPWRVRIPHARLRAGSRFELWLLPRPADPQTFTVPGLGRQPHDADLLTSLAATPLVLTRVGSPSTHGR